MRRDVPWELFQPLLWITTEMCCARRVRIRLRRGAQQFESCCIENFIGYFDNAIDGDCINNERNTQQNQDLTGNVLMFALLDAPEMCDINSTAVGESCYRKTCFLATPLNGKRELIARKLKWTRYMPLMRFLEGFVIPVRDEKAVRAPSRKIGLVMPPFGNHDEARLGPETRLSFPRASFPCLNPAAPGSAARCLDAASPR